MAQSSNLRGLSTINFYADDLLEAKAWYSRFLGVEPYFAFPQEGPPAYIEFRIGDYQHELGFIDRKYAPKGSVTGPGGALTYWHVDHLEAVYNRLLELGATEYEPITKRGNSGFVTASVVDPFGNVLGIMYNPHYLEVLNK
ncbi:MAG: VOC family protein [Pseudobacter sp.]|uniref:VOC family protein n=1 Tax=Pseudobacter sp. TaxID=2045420 RepID=UPI003F7EDDD7